MSNKRSIKYSLHKYEPIDETSDMSTNETERELEMETEMEAEEIQSINRYNKNSEESTSLNYAKRENSSEFNTMSCTLPLPVLVPIPIITPYLTRNYLNITNNSSKCCLIAGNNSTDTNSLSSNQLVLGVKLPFSALDSQIRAKPPPFVSIPPPLSIGHYQHCHQHHCHHHHHH
ncbi:hypothetical protein EWB00_005897 [Schistosoma japonicum]|uniref:Uncharacterized protein n=1 Tax=Schistosoma japonicum TaxID=6182 RepID=A0A4Z2D180_SCHJA|nr:hypothetical protein EWB00_005897 [Schistosoma japonicum]